MSDHIGDDEFSPCITRRERLWFATVLACLMIAIALLACTSCGGRQYPDQAPTMSDPSVALLHLPTGGTCTAWRVDEHLVATAGHCCKTAEDLELALLLDKIMQQMGMSAEDDGDVPSGYYLDGRHSVPGSDATVLVDDDKHDICILRGEMTGAPIRLAARDPQVGARIWTAGFPRGKYLISDGYWSGRDGDDQGLASSVVGYGASGSPMMDADGRAIGVVVALMPGHDNITFVATLEHLRDALRLARARM